MSEDPFYCGQTFEKIWRFRTEEEMIQAHGDKWADSILNPEGEYCYREAPSGATYGWVDAMDYLLGKPLSEVDFVGSTANPRPCSVSREMAKLESCTYTMIFRECGKKTWAVCPRADIIHALPV